MRAVILFGHSVIRSSLDRARRHARAPPSRMGATSHPTLAKSTVRNFWLFFGDLVPCVSKLPRGWVPRPLTGHRADADDFRASRGGATLEGGHYSLSDPTEDLYHRQPRFPSQTISLESGAGELSSRAPVRAFESRRAGPLWQPRQRHREDSRTLLEGGGRAWARNIISTGGPCRPTARNLPQARKLSRRSGALLGQG